MGSYSLYIVPNNTPNAALLKTAFPEVTGNTGPYPFGKQDEYRPLKLSEISSAGVSPASLWSMADADELASTSLVKSGCAKNPVHITSRCYAYFDGHAATGKVNMAAPFNGNYEQ